jgi:hypothetical protein
MSMNDELQKLRVLLGRHVGAKQGQLCLVELAWFVMYAGWVAELRVRHEVKIQVPVGNTSKTGAMDSGWYCPKTGRWLVARELDGRDAKDGHFCGNKKRIGNARKFAASTAMLKVQVLYTLKNDLSPWGESRAEQHRKLLSPSVEVVSDEQIVAQGGIEGYINRARSLAGLPALEGK